MWKWANGFSNKLCGNVRNGAVSISGVENHGTVVASGNAAGALFGSGRLLSVFTITNCSNTGSITAQSNAAALVGTSAGKLSMENCFNTGVITGSAEGKEFGFATKSLVINNCWDYTSGQTLNMTPAQVEDGEFAFLVGPSGSGKSTIIKLITGELKPTSGSVHVNGYSLERIRKREIPYLRRTVGVVFQDFRLIDKMTVYENVAFAMRVVGAKEKEIRERVPYVLELVGLESKMNRHPNEMSGGEQQRLAIARALVNNPSTIIADEPTGNLNFAIGEAVIKQLIEVSSGKTLIAVTHDERLGKYFDYIIDMNEVTAGGRRDV